jgi:exopolysaccharide biosynthesis polyprenyl glycosylphosphotransferase
MLARRWTFLLVAGDYALFMGGLVVTLMFLGHYDPTERYLLRHAQFFGGIFLLWNLAFYIEGMYSLRSPSLKSLPISVLRALALCVLGSMVFFYLFPDPGITPKRNLIMLAGVLIPLNYGWHRLVRYFAANRRHLTRVAFFTDDKSASQVRSELSLRPWLGFAESGGGVDLPSLGPGSVDLVVVGRPQMRDKQTVVGLLKLLGEGVEVMEVGAFAEAVSGKIPVASLDEAWFLEACGTHASLPGRLLKECLDKGVALALMLVVVPLYAILLPILLIVSGRPLFFHQTRTGWLNRPFTIWKLRTMVVDAERQGAQWSKPGDARITPMGKFLRKTRLDELPQLWNILRGDMSLVGPRPERPELIARDLAPIIPFYEQRHLVKPGVTGWAQVNFRYGYSANDSLEKLQYDLYYVKNQSFWLDLRILLRTAKTVLTGAGQ